MFRSLSVATFLTIAIVACSSPEASSTGSSEARVTEEGGAEAGAGGADAGAEDGAPALAKEIHWFRNSAEVRALARQTYLMASRAVDAKVAAYPSPSAWGVVLDVDETVLDNSEEQKETQGQPFSAEAWTAWVKRKEATAIPGAVAFTQHIHALGGKIVLVTNRMSGTECPSTEENLAALKVKFDAILCKTDTSDKNPRFKAVAAGTAAPGLGAFEILAFVGDNIQDFPDETQALVSKDEAAYADFGSRFFVLPNPMYGSWEKNPQN